MSYTYGVKIVPYATLISIENGYDKPTDKTPERNEDGKIVTNAKGKPKTHNLLKFVQNIEKKVQPIDLTEKNTSKNTGKTKFGTIPYSLCGKPGKVSEDTCPHGGRRTRRKRSNRKKTRRHRRYSRHHR
jgi:hypothetical protein